MSPRDIKLATCACGCGAPLGGKKPGARYASDACRARASRARYGAMLTVRDTHTLRAAATVLRSISAIESADKLDGIAARADQMRLALRAEAHVRRQGGDVGRAGCE